MPLIARSHGAPGPASFRRLEASPDLPMTEGRFAPASDAIRPTSSLVSRPGLDARRARPARMRSGLCAVRSGDADVLGLRTLGASGHVELDLLVLVERLVTAGLDGGVM